MQERDPRMPGAAAAMAALFLDQVTKRIAQDSLSYDSPARVLGEAVRLQLRENTGAAFSMSWGGPLFLAIFSAAASVIVAVMLARAKNWGRASIVGLGLVLGGALGNLLDRILRGGAVLDFIDVGTSGWRCPTFNLADAAITVGGLLLIIFSRRTPERRANGG
ncbi:signal peptidase II [Candidatus Fermentibacteria bacterium]|nr:signal peptidase II [Candidatus Fermentibacteria bacterium]